MSGSNSAISRRRLLKGAGAMWLLSVSQVGLAAVSQVVAVRIWPASSYTRVTVESNRLLKYKQFALSNPERVVVDIEDVNLNSVLKGIGTQIRPDDPYIKSARVGQFDPQTVRMVFELKQNVKPQLFALAPVAGFKERLVMDGRILSDFGVTTLLSLVTKMKFAPPVSSTFVRVAASKYIFSS